MASFRREMATFFGKKTTDLQRIKTLFFRQIPRLRQFLNRQFVGSHRVIDELRHKPESHDAEQHHILISFKFL